MTMSADATAQVREKVIARTAASSFRGMFPDIDDAPPVICRFVSFIAQKKPERTVFRTKRSFSRAKWFSRPVSDSLFPDVSVTC